MSCLSEVFFCPKFPKKCPKNFCPKFFCRKFSVRKFSILTYNFETASQAPSIITCSLKLTFLFDVHFHIGNSLGMIRQPSMLLEFIPINKRGTVMALFTPSLIFKHELIKLCKTSSV